MTTLTVSKAKTILCRLIDQTAETHKRIIIAGKKSNAVLISEEDWNAIQETLYLLEIPKMRQSIKNSMAKPLIKNKNTLRW
jgi:prevent-host-death family protein